jgi:hypothetical protein
LVTGQLTVPEGGLADALRQAEVEEAVPRPKSSRRLDILDAASVDAEGVERANLQMGERAALMAAEPGTRPGVGKLETLSTPWASNVPGPPSLDERVPQRASKADPWIETSVFSLSRMWPHADRDIVRAVENSLARCDWVSAVTDCGKLVERTLAVVAQVCGEPALLSSPSACCLLLGLDGRKYLEFQRVLSSVRESCIPSEHEALQAFAFALGVRQARASISSE